MHQTAQVKDNNEPKLYVINEVRRMFCNIINIIIET